MTVYSENKKSCFSRVACVMHVPACISLCVCRERGVCVRMRVRACACVVSAACLSPAPCYWRCAGWNKSPSQARSQVAACPSPQTPLTHSPPPSPLHSQNRSRAFTTTHPTATPSHSPLAASSPPPHLSSLLLSISRLSSPSTSSSHPPPPFSLALWSTVVVFIMCFTNTFTLHTFTLHTFTLHSQLCSDLPLLSFYLSPSSLSSIPLSPIFPCLLTSTPLSSSLPSLTPSSLPLHS